ncbi:MAG: response regulator, partial [Desulfobacteraceae bacterium]
MTIDDHSKTDLDDILIVDDETANLQLLSELLGREGYQVRPANAPHLAIESAVAIPPKLILMDVKMPDMDGFEACRRLKQDNRTSDLPIIFISALQNVGDRVKGFEAGGVDFISKPFQEAEVLARVRTHINLRNLQLNMEEIIAKRKADLVQSEAKYRSLVNNAMVGVFQSTRDGRFLYVNDALVRMFDFDSPAHMISEGSISRWRHSEDRDRMLAELQKNGSVTNFEAETISHTDRNMQILFSAKILGDIIVGMVMDITERKQVETELQKSHDFLNHLLSSIPDAVFLVKLPERVIEWAEDSHNIMGLSDNPGHVKGLSTLKFFANPEDHSAFGDKQRQAIRDGKRYMRIEVMLLREDGTPFPAEVTGTFYKEKGEVTKITALARDITDRKLAEQKLIDYQKRLKELAYQLTIAEEKERKAIATDLHDFVGQSLALARMQLATLKSSPPDANFSDKLDEISNTLLKALEDTQMLMLELSAHSMHNTGLSSAISDWLEGEIKKYPIETEIVDNVPENRLRLLSSEIRTILFRNVRELVVNAVKHAKAQKISIRLEDRKQDLRIIVDDDGVGFTSPGWNKDQKTSGGFGLFRIKELMSDIDGSLKIISEPGKGCTAILSAPFTARDNR